MEESETLCQKWGDNFKEVVKFLINARKNYIHIEELLEQITYETNKLNNDCGDLILYCLLLFKV